MSWRHLLLLAAALVASACTSSGTVSPARISVEDGAGFTLTQDVRAGLGVRQDFERAVRLLEEERYEDGIALLREVTEEAPTLASAHIDLAIAYRLVEDLESADASIDRALEISPRHPAALNERGILHRRMGRFERARESYEKALAVYPDFHFARRNLAILCDLFLRDPVCALENYERYAQMVPEDEEVAIWIADLRNRVGR